MIETYFSRTLYFIAVPWLASETIELQTCIFFVLNSFPT